MNESGETRTTSAAVRRSRRRDVRSRLEASLVS